MRAILSWLAGLTLLSTLGAGCAMGPLRIEGGERPGARENLAALTYDRAVREFYAGRREAAHDYAALALEIAAVPAADELFAHLHDEHFRPVLVTFTGEPGMPEPRHEDGFVLRAILYPIWGLPFDLIEAPLKGLFAVPVLGDAIAIAMFLPGSVFLFCSWLTMPSAEEREARPDEFKDDEKTSLTLGVVGICLLIAPVGVFYGMNGLEEAAYPCDWHGRIASWGATLVWWWARTPPPEWPGLGVGDAFFANARRIRGDDWRIPPLREEVAAFRGRPLAERNGEVEAANAEIAAGRNPFARVPAR